MRYPAQIRYVTGPNRPQPQAIHVVRRFGRMRTGGPPTAGPS